MKHIIKQLLLAFLLLSITGSRAYSEDSALVLADILAAKGVITTEQREQVEVAGSEISAHILAEILLQKGLLTMEEAERVGRRAPDGGNSRIVNASLRAPATPVPAPQARTETPAVTSLSKLPVTVYGTILLNSFYNSGATNIQDVPLLAPKAGGDTPQNFGMTVRQSRLGLRFQGGEIAGARFSGQAEVDFFGGKAALPNGINMDIVRLRLAYGRLDWQNFSLVAGQDWSIFAPLNPASLSGFAIPDFAGSGNPWIRAPQIRAEFRRKLGADRSFQWQIAATDPNAGDYPPTFQTTRTPGIGERRQMPAIQTRLVYSAKLAGKNAAVGLSSHYNRGENTGNIGNLTVNRSVDSWGVAADYLLPLHQRFTITGELFEGRALGVFSASIGQSVLPVGTPGEHGVHTRGGGIQAPFKLASRWQTNFGYGVDLPDLLELRTGDRSKTQTYAINLIYSLSPRMTFAWEWRRFLTDYKNQPAANNASDHGDLAVSYTF